MTASPADLLAAVEARVAERQRMAQAAAAGPATGEWARFSDGRQWDVVGDTVDTVPVAVDVADGSHDERGQVARHIAAHDPQSVLARCDADLRIARRAAAQAERHSADTTGDGGGCVGCGHDQVEGYTEPWPCTDHRDALATLADLAAT